MAALAGCDEIRRAMILDKKNGRLDCYGSLKAESA
jgi:hypothetical protein